MQVKRYTSRLGSSKFENPLGGHDRARLELYQKTVNLEAGVPKGGVMEAETRFIN
jgi:hypothetical protein